jgi:UDP-N-acetylmuramoylalanine--D-glutamate ligase
LGVPLLSELDFAWKIKCEIAPSQRWIALTGTNGKTTTIQMVQSIFNAGGVNGRVCGNVGEPVIAVLNGDHHYDVLALEVSSFQIEWSELPHYEAVAILNIAEDHIDWHGSFEEYANTKLKILDRCEIAVLNFDDIEVSTRTSSWLGRKIFYSLATPQSKSC